MTYDNTNTGTLGGNRDKKGPDANPKWPDHKGRIETTCPHCGKAATHWLSAWIRTAKASGERFFSLTSKPKDGQGNYDWKKAEAASPAPTQSRNEAAPEDFDDEIPF